MRLSKRVSPHFSKFVSVGVVNTVIDAFVFLMLVHLVDVPVLAASSISFLLGSLNSFCMNKYWTFGEHTFGAQTTRQYVKFLMVSAAVLSLHQICLVSLHLGLGAPEIVAKTSGILLGTTLSFALSKWWVFVERRSSEGFFSVKTIQRMMAQWLLS